MRRPVHMYGNEAEQSRVRAVLMNVIDAIESSVHSVEQAPFIAIYIVVQ